MTRSSLDVAGRAVGTLLARYAELIDAGDFAAVGAFLGDCVVTTEDGTVVATDGPSITRLYEHTTRRYPDGTPRTQHVITNLIVEPDPVEGRWVARSCFTVLQATDDQPLAPIVAGRYRDVVEEGVDGTWRFVERCMAPRLLGVLDHHLLIQL
jgi:3-phenylpropionate/cinnamic acid dioxygenase small subunit